jgi:hypothetical protein
MLGSKQATVDPWSVDDRSWNLSAFQIWDDVRGKAKLQRAKQEPVSTAAN